MINQLLKNRVLWLCSIAFFATLLIGQNWNYSLNNVFTSSKENVSMAFIEQFAQTGNLPVPLNHQFDNPTLQTALTPRDATQLNGAVTPQTFPAVLFFYGLFMALSKPLIILVTPLIFAFIIWFYYKITKKIFGEKTAFYSSALLILLPNFLYLGTSLISDDLLSLLFLLIGLDRFLAKKMPASALAFGLSVLFRLSNAIWVLPFVMYSLFKVTDKKTFPSWKNFALSVFAFLLPVVFILLINIRLYGDVLTSGYSIQYPILSEIIGSSTSLFSGTLADFLRQIFNYLIFLFPFSVVLAVHLLVKNFKSLPKKFPFFLTISTFIFLLLTWQYAGSIFWGHKQAVLNSSFLRYTLPFYLFVPLLSVLSIFQLKPKLQKIFIPILATSFVLTALFFRGGLIEKRTQLVDGMQIQKQILATTDSNALVISLNIDKYIYPKREVLISALLRDKKAFGYTKVSPWEAPLDQKMLSQTLSDLQKNNEPALVIFENSERLDQVALQLAQDSLKLEHQWTYKNISAYNVVNFKSNN